MCCVATRPKMTMYGTTHAHLVHMCWPLLLGLRQMGRSFVASHVFSLLASVEGTTVCLEIPLQSSPPPGDPHLATVSPPIRETVAC